jgi:hypothetical protein
MLSAVSRIRDGNETWPVAAGVILRGAFPVVYATLLSVFCLPLLLMLARLILRGVAVEYRYNACGAFGTPALRRVRRAQCLLVRGERSVDRDLAHPNSAPARDSSD